MTTSHANDAVGLPYKPEPPRPVEAADLEEFHDRHRRDTYWARVSLLVVIFGMLGLNLWIVSEMQVALTTDIDASRMAMSATHDETLSRLEALDARLAAIEARLPVPAVASAE